MVGKDVHFMNKKILLLIVASLAFVIFFGCSSPIYTEDMPPVSITPVAHATRPLVVTSYEYLHNFLHSAQAYDRGENPWSTLNVSEQIHNQQAFYSWDIVSLLYYFKPLWIPDGFVLEHVILTNHSIGARFFSHNEGLSRHASEGTLAFDLDNSMTFEWIRDSDGDEVLAAILRSWTRAGINHSAVYGIENMYYYDFGSPTEGWAELMRTYVWLHEGYVFTISIPLRIIQSNDIVPPEIPALIMASAQRVYVEDIDDTTERIFYELPAHGFHEIEASCLGTLRFLLPDEFDGLEPTNIMVREHGRNWSATGRHLTNANPRLLQIGHIQNESTGIRTIYDINGDWYLRAGFNYSVVFNFGNRSVTIWFVVS